MWKNFRNLTQNIRELRKWRLIMGIINTIKDLRSLWIKGSYNEEENINKMIRIISFKFLREAYFSKKMIK